MEIEKVDNNNQQIKKQARRRLQTNKPYKDRLLNMAEARREIATALKFHRASMKQQEGNYVFQQHPPPENPLQSNSRLFPSTAANGYREPRSGLPFCPPIPPPPPPFYQENLNLVLPKQTLGLNLNFQDFSNLTTSIYHTPMAVYSSSSASFSPSTSSPAAKEVAVVNSCGGIRSPEDDDDDDGYHPFDQVMEFPPWLINANESSCFQQLYDHHFSDEYSPDPALPCMDIGEIEVMDGEWLA